MITKRKITKDGEMVVMPENAYKKKYKDYGQNLFTVSLNITHKKNTQLTSDGIFLLYDIRLKQSPKHKETLHTGRAGFRP